ncbi:MAG TPA: hypothetical protein VML96_08745 [Egibacteraceae bacterium]|nr:hypothetical protein [Egibacteraceae bacterium]
MFIQVIQGQTDDPTGLQQAFDQWRQQLQAGAQGWLGTTAGVTDDGQFVAVARFADEESARRNSDRPEQGEWWAQTSRLLKGEATFKDSTDVDEWGAGGSDDAGFVQIIQGRTDDRERWQQEMSEMEPALADQRPDVIGGTIAWYPDGSFNQTVYFTSEAEAREGERKMDEAGQGPSSAEQDLRYFDLRDPWLASP